MSLSKQQDYIIHIEDMCLHILLDVDHDKYMHGEKTQEEKTIVQETIETALHTHFFSELFICESGSIRIKTADSLTSLFSGDILIIPAEMEHVKLPSDPEVRWKSICFSCFKRQTRNCEKYYQSFQRFLTGSRPFIMRNHPELSHRILHLMQQISKERTRFFALELAALLAYMIDYDTDDTPPSLRLDSSYNMDINRISRLELLIATQFASDLNVQDVADQFYISTHQLNRICRKRYGTTFRQTVINRRLQIAIEMFETTQMTIEQISTAVGFHSRTSFFRAFSAQYGISPNQYRKRCCTDRSI